MLSLPWKEHLASESSYRHVDHIGTFKRRGIQQGAVGTNEKSRRNFTENFESEVCGELESVVSAQDVAIDDSARQINYHRRDCEKGVLLSRMDLK